jgi:3',5'-cyclic AMP phosphodiesterase CpdA
MTRLAHFSDVHLTAKPLGWHPRDWFSKRITGWMNLTLMGRGRRFKQAPAVVKALVREFKERSFDGLAFSGDATGMGFEAEFVAAAHALGVQDITLPPAVAVPGNHDYYTARAIRRGYFEEYFGPWQTGERVGEHTYPFARKAGDVWLIGLNSSTVNRWNWDASGAVGPPQLERFRLLCQTLPPGPRVLVTHYPLRTHLGLVEPRVHRLRDHAAVLEAAIECRVCLWLHGHIHRAFALPATKTIPFPVVCVGSTTQNNRWSYHEYAISPGRADCVRRTYDPDADAFRDAATFQLDLPAAD